MTTKTDKTSTALERVTVNLTPRSSRALNDTVERTGDSKTDTINRAVQVYAYLEEVLQRGGQVLVAPRADAEPQIVKFF